LDDATAATMPVSLDQFSDFIAIFDDTSTTTSTTE